MVDAGQLSVLIITHKFREVTAYCDEITVLRKGKQVGSGKVKDLTTSQMAAMMMGEQRSGKDDREVGAQKPGEVTVGIEGTLRANRDNGIVAGDEINLTVRAGEIVGIAGISGNGQRELVEVLGGQRPASAGSVHVCGEQFHMTRREMFERKFYILPEEPLRNACAPQMSVSENIALRTFDRSPLACGAGWLLNPGRHPREWTEMDRAIQGEDAR